MPVIRLLLVASLLLSQVGCRSAGRTTSQPVPVISSQDGDGTLVTEGDARYRLSKVSLDDGNAAASYMEGKRPAGTVLGFERTPEGLFAVCGADRIPLEPTAHRWERLDETIVPSERWSLRGTLTGFLDAPMTVRPSFAILAILLAAATGGAQTGPLASGWPR